MDPNVPNSAEAAPLGGPTQPTIPQPITPISQPTSQIPPIPSTPPTPKKVSRILIAGLILLFVSVLALVGYYLYQTNQLRINIFSPLASPESMVGAGGPTANWNTYTNTGQALSFKYPTNVETENTANNNSISIGIASEVEKFKAAGGVGGTSPYFIDIQYNQPLENLDEALNGSKIIQKDKITVDNQEATKYLVQITEEQAGLNVGDEVTKVIVENTDSWSEFELLDQNQQQLFDQILSTIKLTSETGVTSSKLEADKAVCIHQLGSSKYWDDTYHECQDSSTDPAQIQRLQILCVIFRGKYDAQSNTCRHALPGEACDPQPAAVCSF